MVWGFFSLSNIEAHEHQNAPRSAPSQLKDKIKRCLDKAEFPVLGSKSMQLAQNGEETGQN